MDDFIFTEPIENIRTELKKQILKYAYREGDFTLASGKKSDYYIDNRRVMINQYGALLVGRVIVDHLIPEISSRKDYGVGGMTMGADPIISTTATVAYFMKHILHPFYIRKKPKGYGTGKMLEGYYDEVKEAVLVEDTITTGGSLIRAIDACRAAGIEINKAITIVDRLDGAEKLCREADVELVSIYTIDEIRTK